MTPLQWPEPASVIIMVFFSFVGGAAVYRANQQIAVEALMRPSIRPAARYAVGRARLHAAGRRIHARLCAHLCYVTWATPSPSFLAVDRRGLHADPDRRAADGALHCREDVARRAAGDDIMYSDAPTELE